MGKCIFCGNTDDITREHIIPKAVFRGGNFNNIIVLSSCKKCNLYFKKFEDRFITFLQIVKGIHKPEMHGKLKRQFSNPLLKKEQRFFRERVIFDKLNGSERMCIQLDNEATNKVLLKICMGIYNLHYGNKLVFNDFEIVNTKSFS